MRSEGLRWPSGFFQTIELECEQSALTHLGMDLCSLILVGTKRSNPVLQVCIEVFDLRKFLVGILTPNLTCALHDSQPTAKKILWMFAVIRRLSIFLHLSINWMKGKSRTLKIG